MDSRIFIKQAAVLSEKIADFDISIQSPDVLQKEINQLFQGLQNPTLPSASKLRDLAVTNGFTVDSRVLNRIQQAEAYWQQ